MALVYRDTERGALTWPPFEGRFVVGRSKEIGGSQTSYVELYPSSLKGLMNSFGRVTPGPSDRTSLALA
jgi:hypothetical protein